MEKSFWKELWLLLLITAVGLVACVPIVALSFIFHTSSPVWPLHISQWAQTIFVMILPPLLWYALRVKGDPLSGFGLNRFHARASLLAILFIIASIPAFDFINTLNASIRLPESLRQTVVALGEENARVMEQMLALDGFLGWAELILLVSVFTAIGEELMFRGALLKCFSFTRLNRHWQAILVGLIFSIIHFEPFGFADRWILGTILSYLFILTGSLWPSIILHATNNFIALLQYKCFEMPLPTEQPEMQFSWWLVMLSFIASALILLFLHKNQQATH